MVIDNIIQQDIDSIRINLEKKDFEGKRTLITGGAGFIGSWLSDVLIDFGAEVTVVDNFSTGRMINIDHLSQNKKFKLEKCDACSGS